MKNKKKPLKFYIFIFLFSTILVLVYTLYRILVQDVKVSEIYTLWFMPVIFTTFYYISDSLLDLFLNRKKTIDYEVKFLDEISQEMRKSNKFLIEEFRKLQNSKRFQDDLTKAYQIYKNGESETYSKAKLEKKYKRDSLEYRAMKFVLNYIEKNKEIQKTN